MYCTPPVTCRADCGKLHLCCIKTHFTRSNLQRHVMQQTPLQCPAQKARGHTSRTRSGSQSKPANSPIYPDNRPDNSHASSCHAQSLPHTTACTDVSQLLHNPAQNVTITHAYLCVRTLMLTDRSTHVKAHTGISV